MLKLLALDRFTILIVCDGHPGHMSCLYQGQAAEVFSVITTVAIAILFFLHGAKLSREAVVQGMMHWKLHALVFTFTFALFPILGLLAKPILSANARAGAVLGLFVHVLFAFNSAIFNCLYVSGKRQCCQAQSVVHHSQI